MFSLFGSTSSKAGRLVNKYNSSPCSILWSSSGNFYIHLQYTMYLWQRFYWQTGCTILEMCGERAIYFRQTQLKKLHQVLLNIISLKGKQLFLITHVCCVSDWFLGETRCRINRDLSSCFQQLLLEAHAQLTDG